MITNDYYNIKQTNSLEHKLYDHLLYCVQTETPENIIERFRQLFLDGTGYSDIEIWMALEQIITSKMADQDFGHILNRCCHILINRWQMHPQTQTAIPAFVALFDYIPNAGLARSRMVRKLRELVKDFTNSEQFVTIRRLSSVISQAVDINTIQKNDSVGSLMRRYPYLYEHCLLSEDSGFEHKETVRLIKDKVQHKFELDLSGYVTYQVRMAQMLKLGREKVPQRVIQPMANPTLLTDREVGSALKHFIGKVESGRNYRDLANNFINHTKQTPTYQIFKEDFYQYLTSAIDPGYGKRQFNNKLYQQLQNILPDSGHQKPSEFLLVRTCSQMLNFLIVESQQRPHHFQFIDLISNTGPTFTVGLLLKIGLFCRKVKPYLEKRFSILFNHYETNSRDGVPWLVSALENLNIALSVHFGSADVSSLNQLM
ncbi:MAG TPA: hypothetical protein V6C58_24290 [Allocoleopsis sp.]